MGVVSINYIEQTNRETLVNLDSLVDEPVVSIECAYWLLAMIWLCKYFKHNIFLWFENKILTKLNF